MIKLKKLAREELIGQLIMVRINPDQVYSRAEREKIQRHYFKSFSPGGVFIHGGTPDRILATTNWLQSLSKIPLFIAADVERGLKGISTGGTAIPHGALLGATQNPDLVYNFYSIIAGECRAVGINMAFAPVVDLLNENPIINIRAFHSNPEMVERLATAAIQALLDGGIIPVIKHYPGHALVSEDTHLNTGTMNSNHPLREVQTRIFKNLLNRFPRLGVMTSHIICPGEDRPVTLSGNLIQQDQLNHDSLPLWITDDLSMDGFTFSPKVPFAVQLLENSHHMWLNPPFPALIFRQLNMLADSDMNFTKKIETKVRRLINYKNRYLKANRLKGSHQKLYKYVGERRNRAMAVKEAAQGIIPLRLTQRLQKSSAVSHIILCPEGQEHSALLVFRKEMSKISTDYEEYVNQIPAEIRTKNIIISVYQRTFAGCPVFEFQKQDTERLNGLTSGTNALMIFWGNILPFRSLLADIATDLIWIPSYMDVAQQAMAGVWNENLHAGGRLPVPLTEEWTEGFQSENTHLFRQLKWSRGTKDELSSLIEEYTGKAFTGAIAGNIELIKGMVRIWKTGRPMNEHHRPVSVDESVFFDLASLTKILSTTPLIIQLVSRNMLTLESTLGELFPEIHESQKPVTIAQLLAHQGGYAAWEPLYNAAGDDESAFVNILSKKLDHLPGEKTIYSDLGFIILGKIIELMHGKSLAQVFRDEIAVPLGIEKQSFYFYPEVLKSEKCILSSPNFSLSSDRYAYINDKNAQLFREGAGHAGLMSNMSGIMKWISALLDGSLAKKMNIRPEILKTSFNPVKATDGSFHALGWDTPQHPSQAGEYYEKSKFVIGHLAYTGCALWIDIEHKKASVLLANRGYTEYSTEQYKELRRHIFTLLGRSLGN